MNQEHNFSTNDCYEFIKLLVEMGGVHYIDANHCIFRSGDGTPVGVDLENGKDSRRLISLYKEGCKPTPGSIYLNPFVELLGKHPEYDWFINTLEVIPGCIVLFTIKSMISLITSKKKDAKFKSAQIIAKFVDKVDDKFEREVQKIRPLDAGFIFYDHQKKTAQLLCDLLDEDFIEKVHSKEVKSSLSTLRKSTITTIQEMLKEVYGTATPWEMMYTATLIACPRFDAEVHVLIDCLNRIHSVVENITEFKLHTKELNEHIEHLAAYHKAMQWLATSSASPVKSASETDAKIANPANIPWNVEAPGGTNPLGNAAPVALTTKNNFLGNVSPVGVTKNPTYNPMACNPMFGGMGYPGGSMMPVTPMTPGLGRVAPVVPTVGASDLSNLAADAYNSVSFSRVFG